MHEANVDFFWIASTVVITVIAFLKIKRREQPVGFAVFAVLSIAQLTAIFFGLEKLGLGLQCVAVPILFMLCYVDWRHKRKKKTPLSS